MGQFFIRCMEQGLQVQGREAFSKAHLESGERQGILAKGPPDRGSLALRESWRRWSGVTTEGGWERSLREGSCRTYCCLPRPFQLSVLSQSPTFPLSHPQRLEPVPSSLLFSSPGTWRPRRSVVFASWGAEEFGLIGSTEFTEVSEPPRWAVKGIPGAGQCQADVTPPTRRSSSASCRSAPWPISTWTSRCLVRGATGLTEEEGNKGAGALIQSLSDPPTANATLRAQGTPPVQSVIFSAAKQVEGAGPGWRSS